MLRQILIPLCFLLAAFQMHAQVSVARWKTNKSQVFAGQPLILNLQIFFSEEPLAPVSRYDEISAVIDNHLRKLGFLIAVPNQITQPRIEKTGDVFASLIWRGAVFQPDSGNYILGKGLELIAFLGEDSVSEAQEVSIRVVPKPVKIDDLPETVLPKAWSVGNFSMSYELNKQRYLSGEAIELKISFKGEGGLASIPPPQIPVQQKFLVYDPRSELDLSIKKDRLVGEKTFTYELQGAYQGDFGVGPINFYFFNPQKFRFDSIRIKSIPLKIVGKDIPQLVEVNALDNFYRDSLEKASRVQKMPFSFASSLVWISTTLLIALLLFGFFREIRKRK